jgi:iron complex outermembrane recepter protein
MVPGLHVARISATKWAISARGFNGLVADKLLVLMDGRSLYSPIHKGVYWDVQDRVLDDIERIEVIRGPGASVWGANAVNGVINIITKHATDTKEGTLALFGGDKYGVGLRQGWQFADQGHTRVYGKFLRDESFANRIGDDANEEWTSGRGGFRVDWANPDGKHALMAQGDIYYGHYKENDDKKELFLSNQFILNRVEKTGGNLMARWNYSQSLASRMSAQFFYDAFHETQSRNRSVGSEVVDVDFQHVLALNEEHEITWGLNYRLSLVELTPFFAGIPIEYSPSTFQNNRFSVFIQDKWRWTDAVEVTVGSKFEHHNNSDFEYEPSLRILWKAANQHRVWAGVSRAVRLPAVTDLSANQTELGPPLKYVNNFRQYENLPSDEVISYELGYRYWDSDRFSIDLAAYYSQYDNNLVANNEFLDLFPEQSIKKSSTLGLEGTIAWRPIEWARFQLSSSFMEFNIQSKRKLGNTTQEAISQDPRFQLAFRSSFDIRPAVELDLWLRYNDPVSGVINSQAIPSYVALDARLAWKPNKNLELAFIANNLTDSRHPEFYDGAARQPLQVERLFWLQGNLKF